MTITAELQTICDGAVFGPEAVAYLEARKLLTVNLVALMANSPTDAIIKLADPFISGYVSGRTTHKLPADTEDSVWKAMVIELWEQCHACRELARQKLLPPPPQVHPQPQQPIQILSHLVKPTY